VRSRLAVPVLVIALVAPVGAAASASAAGELDIVQLNMGQGDAALFRGPCGEVGLLDAGDGSADDVTDQMQAWGADALGWAALTHYDADHIGDLVDLTVDVPVVYDRGGGPAAKDTATYDTYYSHAEARDHVAVDIGDVLTLCAGADRVTFTVVSAGTDGTAADEIAVSDENDQGLCFHVEFGDFDMATCGDLNGVDDGARTDVESAVADNIGDVEVAKVNHHGSAYSSNQTFVDVLQAEVALISVGSNSYGHPAASAIDRWQAAGSTVYLTGIAAEGLPASGDITVSTDGSTGFAVQTERSDAVQTGELDEGGSEPQPAAQARALDDSCPPGQIQEDGFGDVPQESAHEAAVDCVVHWQVANGRTNTSYDPLTSVTRAQMASFIARLIDRASGHLPDSGVDHFGDDNGSTHERNINRLAAAGIVGGKAAGVYDPSANVTRAQMAAFLTRAYDYRAQQHGAATLPEGGDYFSDDDTSTLQREINRAAAAGFTGGYPNGTYQPAGTVRRDQMASFLARVLDLAVEQGMTSVPAAPQAEPEPQPEPQPEPEPSRPANPGNSKNCGDFSTWREAQDWFDYYYPHYGDVAQLDADNDMVACESLPGAP
jgi:beta-lactamase superfamily II metal-dependent hydrolase